MIFKRRVVLTQYFLVMISLSLLGCIFFWPLKSTDALRSYKPTRLAANQANVLCFTSVDKQNRPFVITSQTGQQISTQEILLHQIEITLHLANGEQIKMKGDQGLYNQTSKQMNLTGHVYLEHTNGIQLTTHTAIINFDEGTAHNNELVEGHNKQAKIKANGFKVLEQGQHIVCLGTPELTAHS